MTILKTIVILNKKKHPIPAIANRMIDARWISFIPAFIPAEVSQRVIEQQKIKTTRSEILDKNKLAVLSEILISSFFFSK